MDKVLSLGFTKLRDDEYVKVGYDCLYIHASEILR